MTVVVNSFPHWQRQNLMSEFKLLGSDGVPKISIVLKVTRMTGESRRISPAVASLRFQCDSSGCHRNQISRLKSAIMGGDC